MNDLFDVEDITKTRFVDPQYEWGLYGVKASDYDRNKRYRCTKKHQNLQKPALYPSGTSFNPKTGAFQIRGTVVVICGICKAPVHEF